MNIEKLRNFPKPYSLAFSGKGAAYGVFFDNGELFIIPVRLGIPYARTIVNAMNGAYFEGYIQKERETGELFENNEITGEVK